MAWTRAGTASFVNGSADVTFSGVNLLSAHVNISDALHAPDGRVYEILSVNSDTSATLAMAYLGVTANDQAYAIQPTRGIVTDLRNSVQSLIASVTGHVSGALAGRFGPGTLTSPGIAFEGDVDTGLRRRDTNDVALVAGGVDQIGLVGGAANGAAVEGSGKLLTAGAYGVGGEAVLPSAGIGLDDPALPNGTYRFGVTVSPGTPPSGASDGVWVHMKRGAGLRAHQMFYVQTSDAVYVRFWNGSAWSDWRGMRINGGENANGKYVRLPDGTLICEATIEETVAVATASGGLGYRSASVSNFTFPAAFSEVPTFLATPSGVTSIAEAGVTTSGASFYYASPISLAAAARKAHCLAIGRWF